MKSYRAEIWCGKPAALPLVGTGHKQNLIFFRGEAAFGSLACNPRSELDATRDQQVNDGANDSINERDIDQPRPAKIITLGSGRDFPMPLTLSLPSGLPAGRLGLALGSSCISPSATSLRVMSDSLFARVVWQ